MSTRRHASSRETAVKIEMTPMIDVVFLLLIFLLLASKPIETLSRFATKRAAGVTTPTPAPIPLLNITVCEGNRFELNGVPLSLPEMSNKIARIAHCSTSASVLIQSSERADHGGLVQAMDVCFANNLTDVLVGSF